MMKKVDHVGLVFKETQKTISLLSDLFGFEVAEVRAEPDAGFKSTLIAKSDVALELIEPVGPRGMMQKFVEKRGEGMHHLSIQVADLEEEIDRLRGKGVRFVSDQPVQVTDSTKVIFIHPHSTNGLLIELIQRD